MMALDNWERLPNTINNMIVKGANAFVDGSKMREEGKGTRPLPLLI